MNDIITVKDLQLWYGQTKALKGVSMNIPEKSITALIGPSGCGKSTFLKTLDRMNDLVPGVRIEGEVKYNGQDICTVCRRERAAARDRHGLPEAEPLSHEHLRQHCLWPPDARRAQKG